MSEHTTTPSSQPTDIRQLRRQAKELLRDALADVPTARNRLRAVDAPDRPKLAHAQLAIARELNHASWPQLRLAVAEHEATAARLVPAGPMFRTKYRNDEAVFTPQKFLDGATAAGWEPGPLPDALMFVFHGVYAQLLDDDDRFERNTRLAPSNSTMFTTTDEATQSGRRIGVTCLSGGAGAMIGQVEHQVQMGGATEFMILGTAGAISDAVAVGDVIGATSAVRDDGVSQHYLPPDTHVDADAALTERMIEAFAEREIVVSPGVTWTVPTPYRCTAEEIEHFAADGVGIVECEVASLFAVAEALGVAAAACLAVTSSHVDADYTAIMRPPTPADLLAGALATLGLG